MYIMAQKEVITELNTKQFTALVKNLQNQILIIKFTADWCGPCKKIKPLVDRCFRSVPSNVILAEIDVDENLELYMAFKRSRMVNGIPAILAYYAKSNRDSNNYYIPDDSVVGADEKGVSAFFERCGAVAITLK